MADGSVNIAVNMNVKDADKQLAKLKGKIQKTEQEIDDMTSKRNAAQERSVFQSAELDAEKQKLSDLKAQLVDLQNTAKDKTLAPDVRASASNQIPALRQDISDQQQRVNALQREWNSTASSVDKYDQRIVEASSSLEQQVNEAGQLEQQIAIASGATGDMAANAGQANEGMQEATDSARTMPSAIEQAAASMDAFTRRIKGLAKRVFVFTLITKALRALRTWLWNSISANEEAAQAVANLKGALLTLAQPLLNVIIPAFTWFVNVLTKVFTAVARVVSLLFGSNIAKSAADAQKALNKEAGAIGNVGSAAEEAAGSLAGFDEINTIDTSSPSGGGGGGGGGASTATPDFASLVDSSLDAIVELFSGLALLALGAILAFTGVNIPLGIGLMAIGAALLADAVTANWEALKEQLQGPIGGIVALVGTALLVVGAVLAFSGINIPLGIALMAIGAAGMATVVAANWEKIKELIQGPLGEIMIALGAFLLVLGVILLFSGAAIPLGLGLIVVGAASLVASVAANWSAIQTALQGTLGTIVAIISAFLLVLGIVLLFTGAAIPLGLGLLVIGAAGLAATIAANWNTIQTALDGPIGDIVVLVSGALLVLGAVLLFTGAAIPLALGLMAAGAAGLAATKNVDWEHIQKALQGPIGEITAAVSAALLVLGAVLLFTGAGIPLGLGLMAVGAAGLAATIVANWETIQTAMQGPVGAVTAIVSGALIAIGAILLFTGAGIPLGLGLIAVGAAGLAAAITPNWGWLKEKLGEVWEGIVSWWNTNVGTGISQAIGGIKETFGGLIDFISGVFTGDWSRAWEGIKEIFSGVWDGITGVLKTAANLAISLVEGLINLAIDAINLIITGVNGVGSLAEKIGIGWYIEPLGKVSLPRLAQGAVIPPNREFMAVLGDQKTGTNIEAPESLIRQIVREETGGNTEILRQILEAIRAGSTIEVDGKVFGRTAIKNINSLNRSAGRQLLEI